MTAFLKKFLLLAPVLLFVVGMNIWVDPGSILDHGRTERAVAAVLRAGHNCMSKADLDVRLFREALIESGEPAEVVVFGSSRAMQVRQAVAPGARFLNLAVPNADIEDIVGLHGLLIAQPRYPQTIILCAEPWFFNREVTRTRHVPLNDAFGRGMRDLGATGEVTAFDYALWRLTAFEEFVSPAYLRISLRLFPWNTLVSPRSASPVSAWLPTPDTIAEKSIWLADGSLSLEQAAQEKTRDQITREVALITAPGQDHRSYGHDLCPERIALFEALLDAFARRGASVVLVLPPFHPLFYTFAAANPDLKVLREAETYYRKLAAARGIPLLGSYDPDACGAGRDDFFDDVHPRPGFLSKLLTPLPARSAVRIASALGPGSPNQQLNAR